MSVRKHLLCVRHCVLYLAFKVVPLWVTISYATGLRKNSTISHSMDEKDSFTARSLKRRAFWGFQFLLLSPEGDKLEPRHPV